MKRVDRLRAKLDAALARRAEFIAKGRIIEAGQMTTRINILQDDIKEAERYEPQQLGKLISRETLQKSGLAKKLIKTHLAADYLADCAFDARETLEKLGLAGCSIFPPLQAIQKQATAYAGVVCHPDFAGLSDFMINDEQFIDDMHGTCDKYIEGKLNLYDENADAPWKTEKKQR